MNLYIVIWKETFVEKLAIKHGVEIDEVEDVLFSQPHVRLFEKGHIKGENLYAAFGPKSGRYLIVFFVLKHKTSALPISARDMTGSERNYYDKQKENR